jgi:ABC-type sugar transport system ATPase subunit
MPDVALSMVGINKSFGRIPVLKNVALEVKAGEVRALLGENGAGKSSLMKILMGVYQPDSGEYFVGGKRAQFAGPADAQRNRVSMVYQEFGLVRYLSVTENILMGRLPTRLGRIDWTAARKQAGEILARLGSSVSPDAIVGDLKVADQQEVEIARALSYDPLVFVMDEPSSALSRVEIDNLYKLVNALRRQGVAIIYISHKLEEVFALADKVTVLRDGSVVGTYDIGELDVSTLVERMTGKPVSMETALSGNAAAARENVLEVEELSSDGLFENVSFSVGKGTIVGIAGVIGAGKSELARAIVGALPEGTRVTGRVTMEGKDVDVRAISPSRARDLGIGFVSEDRQAEGIVQEQSVLFNIILPAMKRAVTAFTIVARKARPLGLSVMDAVKLRPREPDKSVALLSGGNQQKVVIGKWLAAQSRLLILDEPTRGIDVGARQEIYDVMRVLAKEQGLAVLLLSSDLREVLVASDRILVMSRGRITREVAPAEANEKALLDMVLPQDDSAPARRAGAA